MLASTFRRCLMALRTMPKNIIYSGGGQVQQAMAHWDDWVVQVVQQVEVQPFRTVSKGPERGGEVELFIA